MLIWLKNQRKVRHRTFQLRSPEPAAKAAPAPAPRPEKPSVPTEGSSSEEPPLKLSPCFPRGGENPGSPALLLPIPPRNAVAQPPVVHHAPSAPPTSGAVPPLLGRRRYACGRRKKLALIRRFASVLKRRIAKRTVKPVFSNPLKQALTKTALNRPDVPRQFSFSPTARPVTSPRHKGSPEPIAVKKLNGFALEERAPSPKNGSRELLSVDTLGLKAMFSLTPS